MLIQVNVTKSLPTEVAIMDQYGREFTQKVEYDWKPQFCAKCLTIGNNCPPTTMPEAPHPVEQPRRRRRLRRVVQMWKARDDRVEVNNMAPEPAEETNVSTAAAKVTIDPIPIPVVTLDPGAGELQQILRVSEQQRQTTDKGKTVPTTIVFSEDEFPDLQAACRNVVVQ